MPFSRITTNFALDKESDFIDTFHQIMVGTLNIPEDDRLISLDQKTTGFYHSPDSSGKYILVEIDMFAGRTVETKKKLYKKIVELAQSVGVDGSNVNIIIKDIEQENWGIRGGQPASEVDLGFKTDV